MSFIVDMPLKNSDVVLEPLAEKHFEPLMLLAQDPTIWTYSTYSCTEPKMFQQMWLQSALEQIQKKERVCFTVSYKNQIVGSSSYYEIDTYHKRLNIGYTWYHPSVWGSKVNLLTKLIMLEHVLENLDFHRVAFSVDTRNLPSCRALEKLGAIQEGILRNHMRLPHDQVRHSKIFSIIREEWPQIKQNIQSRV